MTYEQLVAKIGKPAAEGYEYCDIVFNNAIYAVVQLHKAVELEPDGNPIVFCQNCFDDAGYQEPYPCSTIEAIEKELL
jgi:hypothetical protein